LYILKIGNTAELQLFQHYLNIINKHKIALWEKI